MRAIKANKIAHAFVFFSLICSATLANAQKKSKEAPKDEKPLAAEKAVVAKDKEAVSFDAKDVWNVDIFEREDHKVLVIQDRKYNKAGRLELGLDLGLNNASPYYRSLGYGGHLTYHLSEYLGVEFSAAKYSSGLNPEGNQLDDYFKDSGFNSAKEFRQPEFFTSASAVWSPIYGKFAFFRSNIIYFDVYAQAGLSMFKTKGVKDINLPDSTPKDQFPTDQNRIGSLLAIGVRSFINETWIWRFDVRNNLYPVEYAATTEDSKKNRIQSAFHFSTGISMLFNLGGF